jgi:heterodisulfide reductase subunit A
VCNKDAIKIQEEGPIVEVVSCDGCGACVAVCQQNTIQIPNYTKKAILGEVQGLLEETEDDVALIGFFDDNISYTAADNAGTARIYYPPNMRIVRTPSTALLDKEIILKSLGHGADGIMISETEESHEAELAEKLVEVVKEELKALNIESERIMFQPMVLPIFKVLPKFISDYTTKIKQLGKIPEVKRIKLLES